MNVYIVCRSGPEWNDILDVFADKAKANAHAFALNQTKNKDDVIEKLSEYVVIPKKVT